MKFKGGDDMSSKVMRSAIAFSFLGAVSTTVLFYYFNKKIYLTLAITFGTTAYHLGMRLLVGLLYNIGMKNQADYTKR